MAETRILVGHDRFSVGTEYDWLAERDEDGAVVTFTGKVRNHNLGRQRKGADAGALSGHDGEIPRGDR